MITDCQDVSFSFLKAPCSRWTLWCHHILQPQPLLYFPLLYVVLHNAKQFLQEQWRYYAQKGTRYHQNAFEQTIKPVTCYLWGFYHKFAKLGQKVVRQKNPKGQPPSFQPAVALRTVLFQAGQRSAASDGISYWLCTLQADWTSPRAMAWPFKCTTLLKDKTGVFAPALWESQLPGATKFELMRKHL